MKRRKIQSAPRLEVVSCVMLIVVLCTSCGFPIGGRLFMQRWLLKQPCAAPCWEGVILGVTTEEDAYRILSKSPHVYIVDDGGLASSTRPGLGRELSWLWTDQLIPFLQVPDAQTINILPVSGVAHRPVRQMAMNFPYGFTFRQLVDVYGYPSHTLASVITATAGLGVNPATLPDRFRTLHLIYLRQGFRVAVDLAPADKARQITLDRVLDNVTTFWPGDPAGLLDSGLNSARLVSWAGLQSFQDYCTAQGVPAGLC